MGCVLAALKNLTIINVQAILLIRLKIGPRILGVSIDKRASITFLTKISLLGMSQIIVRALLAILKTSLPIPLHRLRLISWRFALAARELGIPSLLLSLAAGQRFLLLSFLFISGCRRRQLDWLSLILGFVYLIVLRQRLVLRSISSECIGLTVAHFGTFRYGW